jgi:hypothetical protein
MAQDEESDSKCIVEMEKETSIHGDESDHSHTDNKEEGDVEEILSSKAILKAVSKSSAKNAKKKRKRKAKKGKEAEAAR